jgi:hypothetical protein
MLERLEDAEDVAWLKRARKKPLHYRPLEDYLRERKQSMYRVLLERAAEKDLRRLSPEIHRRARPLPILSAVVRTRRACRSKTSKELLRIRGPEPSSRE